MVCHSENFVIKINIWIFWFERMDLVDFAVHGQTLS